MKYKAIMMALLIAGLFTGCSKQVVCGTIAGYSEGYKQSYLYTTTGERFYTNEPSYWSRFMPVGSTHCFEYWNVGQIDKVTK